jgi:FxsC-like protein
LIQVAAPTAANAPENRDTPAYGDSSVDWRPFADQELSLAEYARQVTERFDFDVRIGEIGSAGDRAARPGIIVIDPEFIADEPGRAALAAVAAKLPRWVLPLVVVDQPEDARTRALAQGVSDILTKAGMLPTKSARQAASGVDSLDAFVSIVPVLVAEAGKQYLRHHSRRVLSRPSAPRPRLGQPEGPNGAAAMQDP